MPTYSYACPACFQRYEVFKKLADYRRAEQCDFCLRDLERVLEAPVVRGDYEAYDCPITGKRIEGRRAHQENLKQHGCRVLEAGETEAYQRERAAGEAAFDRQIDSTVEEFYEKLPTAKRAQLAHEVSAGADVIYKRT